jgi:hypothetical protein
VLIGALYGVVVVVVVSRPYWKLGWLCCAALPLHLDELHLKCKVAFSIMFIDTPA